MPVGFTLGRVVTFNLIIIVLFAVGYYLRSKTGFYLMMAGCAFAAIISGMLLHQYYNAVLVKSERDIPGATTFMHMTVPLLLLILSAILIATKINIIIGIITLFISLATMILLYILNLLSGIKFSF